MLNSFQGVCADMCSACPLGLPRPDAICQLPHKFELRNHVISYDCIAVLVAREA